MKEPPYKDKPAKGKMGDGIRYEKRVAKALKELFEEDYTVHHGMWIRYSATEGDKRIDSICQPDIIMIPHTKKRPVIVIEIKLSSRNDARRKLDALYTRVVRKITRRRCAAAQVYRNLGETTGPTKIAIGDLTKLNAGDYAEFLFRV